LEILALLMLGLIAMLAIVPPIIRGKLMDSPLATSQSFQRSMREMANSLEPLNHNGKGLLREKPMAQSALPARTALSGGQYHDAVRHHRRGKAAVRRSRIVTGLAIFASIWGVATLISGTIWCLVVFSLASILLVVYWALSIIVPYVSSPVRGTQRLKEASRPPERQVLQAAKGSVVLLGDSSFHQDQHQ